MSCRLLLLGLSSLALLAPAAAQGEPALDVAPQPGFLVLRNGQALEGLASRSGADYIVTTGKGQIRVKGSDVDLFCRDLEEGYRLKRSRLAHPTAQQHLDLAEFCMRHRLMADAASELAEALRLEPGHPRIKVLERRLQVARQAAPARRPPPKAAQQTPTPAQLEELAAGLPTSAVENFTTIVQPLLVNHCATAGCHGVGGRSSFRLLKLPAGKSPTRRLTLHNLYAAWQQVDQTSCADSPLLTIPIQPHGGSAAPVFTNRDLAKVRLLAEWARQATRKAKPALPASLDTAEPLLQTPAAASREQAASDNDGGPAGNPRRTAGGAGLLAEQGASTAAEPLDPFDPAVFNRRFHPERSDSPPSAAERPAE